MLREEYQIRFNSPGFVGDAEQRGAWRVPPFKALLQHWWRIAVARQYDYDWQKVREAEGCLFGHAWLKDKQGKDWAMRSRVRMKLECQRSGNLKDWENTQVGKITQITHPEVKDRKTGNFRPMRPETYLAYGPLHFKNGLTHPPAINANEQNQLTLMFPEIEQEPFKRALQLMHWFGAVGGRSRNGWGSINLQGEHTQQEFDLAALESLSRPLAKCLELEWPHAVGSDEAGLLIWQTPERNNWQQVMKDLAQTKIKFRTDLAFPPGKPGNFAKRHLLAYPVTNHKVNEWGSNGRLANQLRFKVAKNGSHQFVGVIVHLPCCLPREMTQDLKNPPSIQEQVAIWQSVHQSLSNLNQQGLEIKRIKQ